MTLLDYDINKGTHRSAEEEWQFHKAIGDKFFEWHYFTAPLTGANGHQYFFFLCDFNFSGKAYKQEATGGHPEMIPKDVIPLLGTAHLADYSTDLSLEDSCMIYGNSETIYDNEKNAVILKDDKNGWDVSFALKGDTVTIYAKNNIYECELNCQNAKQVLWMQDKLGKEGFIQEGAKDDFSFYYSLAKLPCNGWLKYTDNGKEIYTEVYGQGWIDRQWGDFLTKSWEWTSFRFADGERINTYNFGNGYQVLSYQHNDGSVESYPSFKVIQNGYIRTPKNSWISWGWDYILPVKEKEYHLVPMSDKDILVSDMNTFFEGLSRIFNKSGEQVGWAVTESMDVKVMNNAPYAEFNNFPD